MVSVYRVASSRPEYDDEPAPRRTRTVVVEGLVVEREDGGVDPVSYEVFVDRATEESGAPLRVPRHLTLPVYAAVIVATVIVFVLGFRPG